MATFILCTFGNDFKAIGGGNLWKNFSGTKLLIVVHEHNGDNYYGWRSWNLTSGLATTFESFFDGGYINATDVMGVNPNGNGRVHYYKRITNGSIASAQILQEVCLVRVQTMRV